RAHGRIQRSVASIARLVRAGPCLVRLDPVAHADAGCDRVLGAREDAVRHAREQRRAEGRALLDLGQLERNAEYRGDDFEPEPAAGAAARGPADRGLDAEAAQELERVAQAVGDSLQYRPDEAPAAVSEGQSL